MSTKDVPRDQKRSFQQYGKTFFGENTPNNTYMENVFKAGVASQRRRSGSSRGSSVSSAAAKAVFTNPWSATHSIIEQSPHKRSPTKSTQSSRQYHSSISTKVGTPTFGAGRKARFASSNSIVEFSPVAEIVEHVEDGITFNLMTPTKQHDGGAKVKPTRKSRDERMADCELETRFELKDGHRTELDYRVRRSKTCFSPCTKD